MKKITTFFALTIFAFAFNSCDAVDELTEIDVDTTITKDLVITVAEGQTTFSESAGISIDDEDVQENLDKIENIEIEKLTYQIISVSDTEDVYASGVFVVSSSSFAMFSDDTVNLTTAAAAGTVYEIEVDQAFVEAFESDLRNGATAVLAVSGTVSTSPVTFTVRVTADVKVTVDAI